MNTFCHDFHGLPQLQKVGKEGEGERDCKWEREGERQTKLWMFCPGGRDGELKVPREDLLSGMSLQ